MSNLECGEVADLIRNPELGEKDFVVVDVRRNDHVVGVLRSSYMSQADRIGQGGHVRGSVQQPAQTFYDDLPKFYEEHKDTTGDFLLWEL